MILFAQSATDRAQESGRRTCTASGRSLLLSSSRRQNGATETSGSDRRAARSSGRRTALWLLVAIVIGGGAYSGLRRGLKGKPDWPLFQQDSRAVWEQGRSEDDTTLFGYLPAAIFALWPFTVFSPEPLGLILFVASNVAAAAASSGV